MIAVESLLFLLAGLLLAVAVARAFGWKSRPDQAGSAPSVKLVRVPRTAEGREETLLTVNDRVILAAHNEGVRLSDFADQLEQLEAVATRMAAALGVSVEFARADAKKPYSEAGIPMGELPHLTDDEIEQAEARLRSADVKKGQGAA